MNLSEVTELLKAARENMGLTQSQAAEKSGITQPYWNEIERGRKTNPSPEVLARMGLAVGLEIAVKVEYVVRKKLLKK